MAGTHAFAGISSSVTCAIISADSSPGTFRPDSYSQTDGWLTPIMRAKSACESWRRARQLRRRSPGVELLIAIIIHHAPASVHRNDGHCYAGGCLTNRVPPRDPVRDAVRALIRDRFDGHVTRAAEAFGVSQPSLSLFLSGRNRLGHKLAAGVARVAPELGPLLLGAPPTRTGDPPPANPPGIPDGSPARAAQGRAVELARQLLAELGEAPPTTVVLDSRYPNREAAIDALVDAGQLTREEAEAAAPVALESDEDLPLLEWVEIIRGAHLAARRGRGGRKLGPGD